VIDIGRDQTGRLMRPAGIEGATRSKRVKTTRPNPTAGLNPDLMKREFSATAPNRLLRYGLDVRSDVGWRCASHRRTKMVLDAIKMSRCGPGTNHEDLQYHRITVSQ
jgi:transposase InsO family protein